MELGIGTNESMDSIGLKGGLGGIGWKDKLGQSDFLKLLVTQLKHQDPLSPLKDRDFIAQMAQFSSLEQMTKVNSNMKKLLSEAESLGAYNFLDRNVIWEGESGRGSGVVGSIEKKGGGFTLKVEGSSVRVRDIVEVGVREDIIEGIKDKGKKQNKEESKK